MSTSAFLKIPIQK